jgi:chromosome segregation protein
VTGRRDSLQSLIRNHSYSTDTVRRLLKPGALAQGMAPVGTLADFIEVSGEHEGVVDEFLREELNYVVVKSWVAAEQGVQLLKSGVDGRATFLIHSAEQAALFEESNETISAPGVTPLKDSIRVLNGFELLAGVDSAQAQVQLPGGRPRRGAAAGGALRARILSDAGGRVLPQRDGDRRQAGQRRPAGAEARVARGREAAGQAGGRAGAGGDGSRGAGPAIAELAAQLEALQRERRLAERDTANQGASLKQMEGETQRVERRLEEWTAQAARNKDAREAKSAASTRSARRCCAWKPSTARPRRLSMSCRRSWPCCGRRARACSRRRRR